MDFPFDPMVPVRAAEPSPRPILRLPGHPRRLLLPPRLLVLPPRLLVLPSHRREANVRAQEYLEDASPRVNTSTSLTVIFSTLLFS